MCGHLREVVELLILSAQKRTRVFCDIVKGGTGSLVQGMANLWGTLLGGEAISVKPQGKEGEVVRGPCPIFVPLASREESYYFKMTQTSNLYDSSHSFSFSDTLTKFAI